ncbi:hypothetical protein EZY14_001595 [Kordia sp. TARA_039_SRF]|nr:hypothetical protein EZY14_001595 [Kordia sp. TARA_039_SRF]
MAVFFGMIIVFPIMLTLIIMSYLTKKKIFLYIPLGIAVLLLAAYLYRSYYKKPNLEKEDYYGSYVIDRNYFSGQQADWQYNTFRFEIKENDSIYFYVTEKEEIIKVYKGTISTVTPYNSARLIIDMEQPAHHVMKYNPTTYREIRNYFLVFKSPKFNNMYFRKGTWKEIKKTGNPLTYSD